jgi:hypothetical protein
LNVGLSTLDRAFVRVVRRLSRRYAVSGDLDRFVEQMSATAFDGRVHGRQSQAELWGVMRANTQERANRQAIGVRNHLGSMLENTHGGWMV